MGQFTFSNSPLKKVEYKVRGSSEEIKKALAIRDTVASVALAEKEAFQREQEFITRLKENGEIEVINADRAVAENEARTLLRRVFWWWRNSPIKDKIFFAPPNEDSADDIVDNVYRYYSHGDYAWSVAQEVKKEFKREYLKEKTTALDEHLQEAITAKDPNIKYGPEGYIQPGQKLDYKVEYENEGEGIAFGVYFTDTLDEDLDDSTLEVGPVISTIDGSEIAPAGTYNSGTRTITWLVGEVGPGEEGYTEFSVAARSDASDGTEIINFATVYFPSVPEVTRTNGIVSIIRLNQPPLANPGGPYEGNEGSSITFNASASSDPDGEITLYEWDWDADGVYDDNSSSPTIEHIWTDDFQGEVGLRVTDNDGLTNVNSTTVTISNVLPNISSLIVENQATHANQEIWVGDTLNFTADFTDLGWLDTHTANWNFGDGNTQSGVLTEENNPPQATGQVTGSHVYQDQDSYTVTLKVEDDNGGISQKELAVEVKPIPANVECQPNSLNQKSKGKWITCYIQLTEGYDIWQIDGSTVTLNEAISAFLGKQDWAKAESNDANVVDYDKDGILERMVKFDRDAIQKIISGDTSQEEFELYIDGRIERNEKLLPFEGENLIKVKG